MSHLGALKPDLHATIARALALSSAACGRSSTRRRLNCRMARLVTDIADLLGPPLQAFDAAAKEMALAAAPALSPRCGARGALPRVDRSHGARPGSHAPRLRHRRAARGVAGRSQAPHQRGRAGPRPLARAAHAPGGQPRGQPKARWLSSRHSLRTLCFAPRRNGDSRKPVPIVRAAASWRSVVGLVGDLSALIQSGGRVGSAGQGPVRLKRVKWSRQGAERNSDADENPLNPLATRIQQGPAATAACRRGAVDRGRGVGRLADPANRRRSRVRREPGRTAVAYGHARSGDRAARLRPG
jgi:hypothetical protein